MRRSLTWGLAIIGVMAILAACSGGGPSLKIDKPEVNKGQAITVTWTAPSSYQSNAWIGIVPSSVEHGDESRNDAHDVSYKYLNGKTSGSFTFTAPDKAGSFDFRMHDTDSGGKEVASVTFKVK